MPDFTDEILILDEELSVESWFDSGMEEPEAASVSIVIDYPVFHAPTSPALTIDENGFQQAIVWENGAGIRFGNWVFMDGNTLLTEPYYSDPGSPPLYWKSAILDWLCFKRLFGGQAADDGTMTELEDWLIHMEEWVNASEANDGCIVCLIDNPGQPTRTFPLAVIVPGYREFAPICSVPVPARDSDKLQTGDLAQESWSHVESRTLIQASQETHFWNAGGAAQITSLISSLGDWKLTGAEIVLDNAEGVYPIKRGTLQVGEMRPWRGFFGVVGAGDSGTWIASDVGLDKRHAVAWGDGTNTTVRIEDHNLGQVIETELAIASTAGDIRIDRTSSPSRIRLHTVEGGSIYVRESTDGAVTFGSAELRGTGEAVTAPISLSGIEYEYWIEDTGSQFDIKGQRYDRAGNSLESEFTAWADVDNAGVTASVHPTSEGKQRVVLRFFAGGVRTAKTSQDGVSFA